MKCELNSLIGISSRKITHVILTHCHADHDAGTFQKILLEQRVTVLTTRTIMAAFVRKYAPISELRRPLLLIFPHLRDELRPLN